MVIFAQYGNSDYSGHTCGVIFGYPFSFRQGFRSAGRKSVFVYLHFYPYRAKPVKNRKRRFLYFEILFYRNYFGALKEPFYAFFTPANFVRNAELYTLLYQQVKFFAL